MATPNTIIGQRLLIQIGDGGNPETFAADCLINTERGISFQSETNQEYLNDCDDYTKVPWQEITKTGMSASITGSGVLHTNSVQSWFDFVSSDTAKTCRVVLMDVSAADGGGSFEGEFKCSSFEMSGSSKEKATASITLQSHGALTFTAAS